MNTLDRGAAAWSGTTEHAIGYMHTRVCVVTRAEQQAGRVCTLPACASLQPKPSHVCSPRYLNQCHQPKN